ncbi:MAG TPA: type VI secretion system baseplate subunit TssE [Paludibaculum sp.]|jgi:type VI secretion system protein ImpF
MARSDQDVTVTPSVLDRLIDLDRVASADPPANRTQSVRQLKASLRRDLEWLLNTRRNPDEAPEAYEHLSISLYNYGLPDVSSMSVDSPRDRNRLLRMVELTVQTFEPRLASVRVRPVESTTSGSRSLRFQIEGMLRIDPAPEQIYFDTVLQLNSGEYQLKGD